MKQVIFFAFFLSMILISCGRDCPNGINYYDPQCPNYVGNYYGNYPYYQYPSQPQNYPYQQTPYYPYYQQNPYYPYYQQSPYYPYYYQQGQYYYPQAPVVTVPPPIAPTVIYPNNYQYPCSPTNPYCY